ncbi:MAG: adenylyl-sulfate kinase [Proteobacteria bacterium]|nr:adenylyl-sulfate kinase [Pseudomonadota bacterium]
MSDSKITNQNTRWHEPTIKREHREKLNEHKGKILWFTGLSGAGKSTLAHALEEQLHDYGARTYVLDGDNVRKGLCKDLGFSEQDRVENIRRIGEMSRIMMDAGLIVMTAFISPFRRDRRIVRELVETGDFIEIFCDAPLDVCESRDVKGLYEKARAGEIPEFTGISSPYETPENPELIVESGNSTVEECVDEIINFLKEKEIT